MPINKSELEISLSLFQIEEGELRLSGDMNMVFNSIMVEASTFGRNDLLYFDRFNKYLNQDLWNIYSVLHRLNWQRTLWIENKIPDHLWRSYAQNDINLFHIEFRSAMDYIARIIARTRVSATTQFFYLKSCSCNLVFSTLRSSN